MKDLKLQNQHENTKKLTVGDLMLHFDISTQVSDRVSALRSGSTSSVGTLNLGRDVGKCMLERFQMATHTCFRHREILSSLQTSGNVVKDSDVMWFRECEKSWSADFDESKRVSKFDVVFGTEFEFDVTHPIETHFRRLRWDVPETIDFGMSEIGKVAEIPLKLVNPAKAMKMEDEKDDIRKKKKEEELRRKKSEEEELRRKREEGHFVFFVVMYTSRVCFSQQQGG